MLRCVDGVIRKANVPALQALNMRLRDDYVENCERGILQWNRIIKKSGIDFDIMLPSVAFNRAIGEFSSIETDLEGNLLSPDVWQSRKDELIPNADDGEFIEGLMKQSAKRDVGGFSSWIAPPKVGINNKPGDFEYVKFED